MNTSAVSIAPAPRWTGPVLMAAGAVAIGFAPIGLRLSAFEPQATAFWRFAFALPLIAGLVWMRGEKLGKPSPMALVAGTFFGLDIAFWHASLVMTSVANATFLVNLGNAAVGVVAWLVLRERPTKVWFVAIAVALAGAWLLSRGAAPGNPSALAGDMLALLAAVMVGLYLFFAKLARREQSAMAVLFWSTAATLAVSAIACGVRQETLIPPDPSWFLWPLALAVVAHVLGQGLIVAGVGQATSAAATGWIRRIRPARAAVRGGPDADAAGRQRARACRRVACRAALTGKARPFTRVFGIRIAARQCRTTAHAGPVRFAKRRHGRDRD